MSCWNIDPAGPCQPFVADLISDSRLWSLLWTDALTASTLPAAAVMTCSSVWYPLCIESSTPPSPRGSGVPLPRCRGSVGPRAPKIAEQTCANNGRGDQAPPVLYLRGLDILVSVERGHRRVTLAVPDDLPVEALLPLLVEACGADRTATWALIPRGGGPIEARRNLREAGIWPGAVLALRLSGAGEQPRAPVVRAVNLPDLPGPAAPWRRLGAAIAAAVSGGDAVALARAGWRATGRVAALERVVAAAPRSR